MHLLQQELLFCNISFLAAFEKIETRQRDEGRTLIEEGAKALAAWYFAVPIFPSTSTSA